MLSDLRYRLRAVFRRRTVERELDDEVRFHIDRETEKYIRAGMWPAEARRQANIAFGGVERMKEDIRDARGVSWFETIMQDLRYAARGLKSSPGFTIAVALTLGLGIGANAAMFGIIDRLMFRPPAYLKDPEHVHRVYLSQTRRGEVDQLDGYEYTRYLDLEKFTTSFDKMVPYADRSMAVGKGDNVREMTVLAVGGQFFDLFDAPPALGRYIRPEEDHIPKGAEVAVLSYPFWQANYGGRTDIIDSLIQIGPSSYTIIGVAPKGFVGVTDGTPPVAYIPITTYAGIFRASRPEFYYKTYNWGWIQLLAQRKPNVTEERASADITQAFRRSWDEEAAISGKGFTPKEIALPQGSVGPIQEMRSPRAGTSARVIRWISGVALIVLVIACANVANLLLARALRRRREIAVRLALGASRARLMSQLLTESVLLALLGGAAGLLMAHWGGEVLRKLFMPDGAPIGALADRRTLLFAAGAALLTGLLTGLAPLYHAGRDDLVTSLKTGVREGSHRTSKTRTALLVFQGALSVILLVGAGLFVRSLQNVKQMRLGFDIEPVLYVTGDSRGTKLSDEEQAALMRRLEEEAKAIPGVENASRVLTVPFWDTWSQALYVEGIDTVRKLGSFTLQGGSPAFFRTAGTRILRGRGFTIEDRADAPKVVVVSEAMAKALWPGEEALGKCMRMNADTNPCITVVGVAENMRQNSLTEDKQLNYYLPIEQFNPAAAALYVRTRGPADKMAETIRRRLQTFMPGSAYLKTTPLAVIVGGRQRAWRMGATMFVAFGALALALAALGLYSVIGYDVAQRRHEMGVRVALGADRGNIMGLVFRQALAFVAVGVVIGGVIALASGKFVSALLFQVSPRDPLVFGLVGVVLLLVALVASAVPAWRAARVDPVTALRFE